eukprot:scaffold2585_cov407-Chaetoceros_neogracile.AAC.7
MCNNRHAFCKRHGLSFARISRLASTRDNLRQRVASYLGKDSSSLALRKPPRAMEPSKIIALRILKTWMFYDGIVKLPSLVKGHPVKNDSCAIQIKGGIVDETHLEQVLDHDRHKFTLNSEGYLIFNGAFSPVQMDYQPAELVPLEFEERLLSFSIERSCNFIVSKIGGIINLYVDHAKKEKISDLIDAGFSFEGEIVCTMKNARGGGDCSLWRAQYTEASSYESKKFVKYGISETLKRVKKILKQLRDSMRSQALRSGLNTIILDIRKATGGPLIVYSYGSNDFKISKADFVQLFRTPDVKVQKSGSSALRQSILFEETLEEGTDQCIISRNKPEGARILLALASGRRSKQCIRFKSTTNNEMEETAAEYLDVVLGETYNKNRWIWTETGKSAMLDSNNIPATIECQQNDMYACSGNILELNGGRVLAEGITMLPGGEAFLNLAKECIGISSLDNYCDELEEHGFAAEAFHEYFVQTIAGADLRYFPDAVDLLCKVFNSLNGLEMRPWLKEDHCEESEIRSGQRGDDENLGAEICKSLGDANVPSSFMTLFSGQNKSISKPTNDRDYSTKQEPLIGKYKCITCAAGPFNWGKLLLHVRTSHDINLKKSKDKKLWLVDKSESSDTAVQGKTKTKKKPQYKCQICQAGPFKWKAMKSHAASNHDIAPSNMSSDEWRGSLHNDNSGSSDTAIRGKTKTKKKPQYKCQICQAQPFTWKAVKSHAASNHDIAPSNMSRNEWRGSLHANEVEAVRAVIDGGVDMPSNTNNDNSGSSDTTIQRNTKTKKKPQYKCQICQAQPFTWKAVKSHAASNHDITPSDISSGRFMPEKQRWRV